MPTHTFPAAWLTLADMIDVQPLRVSAHISLAAVIAQMGQAKQACAQAEKAATTADINLLDVKECLLDTNNYVVVYTADKPVGLLTSQDLACCLALEIDLAKTQVKTVMGALPPKIGVSASIEAASQLMVQQQTQLLAVYDTQQQLLGLVTQGSLLRSRYCSLINVAPSVNVPPSRVAISDRRAIAPPSPTERLQIQARQQAAVASLGQKAIAAQDLTPFMTVAAELIVRTLNIEYCQILELLPGRDALLLRAGIGWQPGQVGHAIMTIEHTSQVGHTLLTSTPVIVEDLATDPRFDEPELQRTYGIVGGMSLIIPQRDRPFGVLSIHSTHHRHFSLEDQHFLEAIANILALVTERHRLEQENHFQTHWLSHITDTLPACIAYIDRDLRYRFVNKTYETWFHLDHSTLDGQYVWEVMGKPAYDSVKPYIDRVLKGERVTYEMLLPYVQGSRYISGTLIPDATPDGQIQGYYALITDISDYKRTEVQLRQSQANLAKAQEIAHIGSWEFDISRETLTCSAEMFRLFGLDPTGPAPTLSQIAQFFPPQDWAEVRQAVQQLIDTARPQPFKGRIVRRDGEQRHLEGSGEALKNNQGQVVKLLGTARDVTEHKQRQNQLQLLESVILHANDAVLITEAEPLDSPGPRIIYANPTFSAMTGYTSTEVVGQTPRILQGPKTDRAVLNQIRTALETQQRIRVELINYRKDGSDFWVELDLVPILNVAGQTSHFVALQRNISDRKRNEQKLREQAELIDIASDAFLVRDLDNQICFWSRGAERIYGWQADEALGQTVDQLLHPEPAEQVQAAWQAVLSRGEWQGEFLKYTQDQQIRTIESRWTLVRDAMDNPKAILSVDTDITARKQLEAQFLRAQRLESLGTLASGIAHDLNNILTPILGIAQILRRQLQETEPSLLDLVTILRVAAKRGAALSKQILAFAQGADSELKALNAGYLIREIRQFTQQTFPKSITIQANVPRDLWMLMGDATHLYQVLMNLCVNARDAMPNGGTLSLSARNAWLDEISTRSHPNLSPGPYVVIEVADTGIGIPPELLDQVFDPFFTTKAAGSGTGLGLSTVVNIIKSHKGQLQVTSQIDQGTCFMIYLPAAQVESGLPGTNEGMLPAGTGEQILVVDDEPQIRQVTQALLDNYHYRVLTAQDGPEAIALCQTYPREIDTILLDMRMPKLSGSALVKALRHINPQFKIVAISGVLSSEELAQCQALQVQACLSKPYSVEDLLKTIRTVLKA